MSEDLSKANQLVAAMATRNRVAVMMANDVRDRRLGDAEYIERLSRLMKEQAESADLAAATVRDASVDAARSLENYRDVLTAAADPVTGGQEWAVADRSLTTELSKTENAKLLRDDRIQMTIRASKESAMHTWSPGASMSEVEAACERFWTNHEQQDRQRSLRLGSWTAGYDRSRPVTEAIRAIASEDTLNRIAKTKFEQSQALSTDPDSPAGREAARLMTADRSTGVTRTQEWDRSLGRDRSLAKVGPDMTGPGPDVTGGSRSPETPGLD